MYKTLIIFISTIATTIGFNITAWKVPKIVDPRDDVVHLMCAYNLGDEYLYSVDLYKNEEQFLKYRPQRSTSSPKILNIYHVNGVDVASHFCDLKHCNVTLTNITQEISGIYKCEISTEGPAFHELYLEKNMTYQATLRGLPELKGLQGSYFEGDIILVNCSAPATYPPPKIKILTNDKPVSPDLIVAQRDTPPDEYGLVNRSLSLRIPVTKQLFTPYLRLKCIVTDESQPPIATEQIITMTTKQEQNLTNQKLAWPDETDSAISIQHVKHHIFLTVVFNVICIFVIF